MCQADQSFPPRVAQNIPPRQSARPSPLAYLRRPSLLDDTWKTSVGGFVPSDAATARVARIPLSLGESGGAPLPTVCTVHVLGPTDEILAKCTMDCPFPPSPRRVHFLLEEVNEAIQSDFIHGDTHHTQHKATEPLCFFLRGHLACQVLLGKSSCPPSQACEQRSKLLLRRPENG